MKITFSDLWRSSGTVDRGPYALVGLIGFTLKHNLDRLVAAFVFHRPWTLFNYWVPVRNVARVTALGVGTPCSWRPWWYCRFRLSGWA